MKPADYNAWLDGTASPAQVRRVERAIHAAAEREAWQRTRALLREHLTAPAPAHPDFIDSRVREAIRAIPPRRPAPAPRKLAFAGLGFVAAAAALALAFLPEALRPRSDGELISQVISARAGDPRSAVSCFRSPDNHGVVIWIESVPFIRPEERVR